MGWRETSSPTTIPLWARCDNPFHLFVLTTFFTQVSLVTIGHRAGRSSAFGFAEAELLSASSRPNGLPSRCACCVALTPLSKRHFFEVISCAVKGRTPLRTARASCRDRNAARATGGREFPICTLSVVQRVPSSTMVHGSASPPAIPDGRLSRVRFWPRLCTPFVRDSPSRPLRS